MFAVPRDAKRNGHRTFTDGPPNLPAIVALNRLADYARRYRATAGDVNVLAVEVLREIDRQQDYGAALDAVTDRVERGEILTVSRQPMRGHLSAEAVAGVLEAAASAGRMEAWALYVAEKGGQA